MTTLVDAFGLWLEYDTRDLPGHRLYQEAVRRSKQARQSRRADMPTVPDDLGRTALIILGYGVVCVGYGTVFGYVVGPSIVRRLLSLLRRL